jgi:hypothetical protein
MGNLIINLDSLASGRLDITTGAFDYNTTLNLDPLASGRLDDDNTLVKKHLNI